MSGTAVDHLMQTICGRFRNVQGAVACAHEVQETTLTTAEQGLLDPRWHLVRRHEFAMGRLAAHRALIRLNGPAQTRQARRGCLDILRDSRGAPIWPGHARGSISHTRTHAVAVVASRSAMVLGVDIVDSADVRESFTPLVLAPAERRFEPSLALAPLIASKEAAIKVNWFWRRELLGPTDLTISLDGRSVVAPDGARIRLETRSDGAFALALCMVDGNA